MRLFLILSACAFVLGSTAAASAADDALPPEKPTTPYEATVRNSFDVRRPGGGSTGSDTLDIRVSGGRLYEKSKLLPEKAVIVDTEKREVYEFDPDTQDEPKIAGRFDLSDSPIPYVHGRSAIASYDASWDPPKIAGEDEVAKQKCTVLHYGDPATSGVAACVSKQGVVMRMKIVLPDFEREFEILEFDDDAPDEKWFRVPEGFQVVAPEPQPALEE
jgi:hypothetical protein